MKIFLFHRINESPDAFWPPMKPKTFENLIKIFVRRYHVVNLEDYLLNKTKIKSCKKKFASIVFDDGYKDFMHYALPILTKYKIKPSMYIVTNTVETNEPIWTYKIDYTIANTSKKLNSFNSEVDMLKLIDINDENYRIKYARIFKKFLKKINNDQREIVIKEFLENFNDVRFENNLYLNWGDLNELKDFVAIGSHTHTHPMLGKILNENEIYDQMIVSKNHIKKNLNIDCEIISYPNGSFNNLVKIVHKSRL